MSARKCKIEITDVSKVFLGRKSKVVALQNFNLRVGDGEFLCILGPSGCGKSTLLNIIAGLIAPTTGEIRMNGKQIQGTSYERGLVFQDLLLFPWLSTIENIKFGLQMRGIPRDQQEMIARKYIDLVGLIGFENSYIHELSGGMQQRVALARVLSNDPEILLMDEPFGALDAQTRILLQEELLRIWERDKKTVIFVTHDVDESIYLADRVALMTCRPGQIKKIIEITMKRPRERTSIKFNKFRRTMLSLITEEAKKAMKIADIETS